LMSEGGAVPDKDARGEWRPRIEKRRFQTSTPPKIDLPVRLA
jgi:hypothetical protein